MNNINQTYSSLSTPLPEGRGAKMGIQLTDAGKRFNRDWIFRCVNYFFETGKSYAITGPNGSGKSTLLQAIAGSMYLSEGALEYRTNEQGILNDELKNRKQETGNKKPETVEQENIYQHLSISAPYLELIEEMTAKEFLHFHHKFKPFITTVNIEEILSIIGLEKAADKQIRYFSSGMKQRIKLAQAIFSDVPVLLLDEPCTNLDKPGYELYHSLISKYCQDKLIIVSSNDVQEIDFCDQRLNILDYK